MERRFGDGGAVGRFYLRARPGLTRYRLAKRLDGDDVVLRTRHRQQAPAQARYIDLEKLAKMHRFPSAFFAVEGHLASDLDELAIGVRLEETCGKTELITFGFFGFFFGREANDRGVTADALHK